MWRISASLTLFWINALVVFAKCQNLHFNRYFKNNPPPPSSWCWLIEKIIVKSLWDWFRIHHVWLTQLSFWSKALKALGSCHYISAAGKKPLRLNLTRSFIHWLIKRQEAKSAGSPTTTLGRLPPRKPNKMAKWQVLPSLILLAHIEHLPVNLLFH